MAFASGRWRRSGLSDGSHRLRSHTAPSLRGVPLGLDSLQASAVGGGSRAARGLGLRPRSPPPDDNPNPRPQRNKRADSSGYTNDEIGRYFLIFGDSRRQCGNAKAKKKGPLCERHSARMPRRATKGVGPLGFFVQATDSLLEEGGSHPKLRNPREGVILLGGSGLDRVIPIGGP